MRDAVTAFAQVMEQRLSEHDGPKGESGWRDTFDANAFLRRLKEKRRDLRDAYNNYERMQIRRTPLANLETCRSEILELAADMGNYAMFVADHCRALPAYDAGRDNPAFTDRDD